jgi:hypothetical protein
LDVVQLAGGTDNAKRGLAGRTFQNAININYEDQYADDHTSGCGASNHCGTSGDNPDEWLPYLKIEVQDLNSRRSAFDQSMEGVTPQYSTPSSKDNTGN